MFQPGVYAELAGLAVTKLAVLMFLAPDLESASQELCQAKIVEAVKINNNQQNQWFETPRRRERRAGENRFSRCSSAVFASLRLFFSLLSDLASNRISRMDSVSCNDGNSCPA
jgi:transposase-like protein